MIAKIMSSSIFPASENRDHLSWDHRHFVYFLTRKYDLNWAKYIFDHICKSVLLSQNQAKSDIHVVYPRVLSEIFYQCGVIDIIKATGHDYLLRECRASTLSAHSLACMNLLSELEAQPSEPLVYQSHSEPSLVKKWNIGMPTISCDIVNKYIQLLDNLGEGFETEKVVLKKKRRRLVKAYEVENSKSDDEPLSVRQRKLLKVSKENINESSDHNRSGNVSKSVVATTQDIQFTSSSTQPLSNYNQTDSEDNLTIKQLISEPVKSTHPEPVFINISSSSSSTDSDSNELDEILANFELLNAKSKHKRAQLSMAQTFSNPHTSTYQTSS
jgi:hypothetical protein